MDFALLEGIMESPNHRKAIVMSETKTDRRQFIKTTMSTGATAAAIPVILRSETAFSGRSIAASDKIRIATIGMGGMGFGDTRTALQVPGVEFVAAADCYDGRLERVKEVFGADVSTTRDYREIIGRADIDAVIVATPDHWHTQIAIDSMREGKAVYLEKPMVHSLDEGPQMMKVQKETGGLVLVGSQRVSSVVYEKARELYSSGAIGTLNMVEAYYNRNSAIGAWQYSIPLDASPKTIDWEGFLGPAPRRPFDAVRFFRWRNYWDYGTGVPGDLFVHLFSGIHFVLGSNGPERVMSTGGLRHWKDGRDAPDVMVGLFDYGETPNHPPFNMALQVNFADGSGGGQMFRFVGSEGVMTISGNGVEVSRMAPEREPGYRVGTFSAKQQAEFVKEYHARYPEPKRASLADSSRKLYEAPGNYNSRLDHFTNFFEAMRSGGSVIEDVVFGYRAAAPALLCNLSYLERKPIEWKPEAMTLA
jgi:predicted dehydrogenase